MKSDVAVFWFRRDLRLRDNTALFNALKFASEKDIQVLPVFVFDVEILEKLESRKDARVDFIHDAVSKIDDELRELGSGLSVFRGKPHEIFSELLSSYRVHSVFANRDYEPYAIDRDRKIAKLLKKSDLDFFTSKDQVIFEKSEVAKDDGKPYTVFTPYSRKWKKTLTIDSVRSLKSESLLDRMLKYKPRKVLSLEELGFERSEIQAPSSKVSKKTIEDYAKLRDIPSVIGTSRLGIHLRFGTVSVRELVKLANATSETWLNELIWREFFMQILFHFPHVASGPFRPEYAAIKFRHDEKDFKKWCEGKTGYPIVDAGMRELNATGFMHNRVRMIAASFLVKHLLIDPKWGERYFANHLLDFELASNNGNWQWVAGTGCDAAPYFRVFNPELQQKKFDDKFEYIRKWVPEFETEDYPEPMVVHEMARARVLAAYNLGLGKKAPAPSRKR